MRYFFHEELFTIGQYFSATIKMISFLKIIHIDYSYYFVHTDMLLNHSYETKVVAVIFLIYS